MSEAGEVLDDRRISHADHAEMERFLDEFDKNTDVVMEAAFNRPRVVDLAEKCGVRACAKWSQRAGREVPILELGAVSEDRP